MYKCCSDRFSTLRENPSQESYFIGGGSSLKLGGSPHGGGNFHLKVGGAKSSGSAGDPMLGFAVSGE